ncbi:MAG TPA: serine/threonine-protein kinase [Archangium sp.]|uniref:serine/threonine-protein kinase n=1 Tax=Archangium sp. TaxID=1872627 RepID=UPI002E33BFD5|nr:serine/threonine-protein kinase [Archangium sp.]HEX5752978.1 serine/threonine-protein kinase [Archangium sp.]
MDEPRTPPGNGQATQEESTRTDVRPRRVGSPPEAPTQPLPGPSPARGGAVLAPGQVVAERYTVLALLGQGGMGVVLSAYDARLDRRVALKVRHQDPSGSGGGHAHRTRMLREAQAMARLAHPNVVAVYDAGTLEDGSLYIAMEQVEGQTLRAWCKQQPRSWREVVAMYVAAGRGLVAAHEAGLVHRDFKPDNVLVGSDGRARVTDFGVARVDGPHAPPPAEAHETDETPSPGVWETPLTLPGRMVGTPKYLAPEILDGQAADARSDMFAFCVALHEALHGQPAFAGKTPAERMRAQREGRLNPLPAQTQVPAWVGRVVRQGLEAQPRRRPDSMRALLRALEDDPEQRSRARLRAAGVGALVLALSGLAAVGWLRQREQGPRCEQMPRRLAGVWDETVEARVRRAFLGTGLAYAEDTFQRTAAALDAYASEWGRRGQAVCEALRGGNASSLRLQEEACLERRRGRLEALTALFARGPDPELLPRAVQAVQALESLESCADAEAQGAAPPQDAALRARVAALRMELEALAALYAAGRYREGVRQGEALLASLEAVPWPPLKAEALYHLARLQEAAGDYAGAEARVREALPLLAGARDERMVLRAWTLLCSLVGERQARYEEALQLELTLLVSARRAADEATLASALGSVGLTLYRMGRYEQARERLERALALRQKALGPEHPDVAASLGNLGGLFYDMGRYEESKAWNERALALRQKVLGPEHPDVATTFSNLGNVALKMDHPEEARAWHERALVLRQKVLGPEHPEVASSLNNLASLFYETGRYAESVGPYERALSIWEKVLGPEHPDVALALGNLALALDEVGRKQEAVALLRRALAVKQKALGPEHPSTARTLGNLGNVLHLMGRAGEAVELLRRALAVKQKALGPEHPSTALSMCALGDALRELGRHDEARAHYQRALDVYEKQLGPQHSQLALPLLGLGELARSSGRLAQALPLLERALALGQDDDKAEASQALARALWAVGRERARAVELATQALRYYQQVQQTHEVAELSRWLAQHPPPRASSHQK